MHDPWAIHLQKMMAQYISASVLQDSGVSGQIDFTEVAFKMSKINSSHYSLKTIFLTFFSCLLCKARLQKKLLPELK